MKKTLFCVLLLLCSYISAREADLTFTTFLPEVEVVSTNISNGLYSVLVKGKDSVQVKNGQRVEFIDIKPLDSTLASIVLAQAYLESGSLNSILARTHNNFYGMQHSGKGRYTTSLGPWARAEGRGGYASYATPEDSALDLVCLLDYYKMSHGPTTPEKYVKLLKSKHYFESGERQYLNNLKFHLRHVQQQHNLLQKSV